MSEEEHIDQGRRKTAGFFAGVIVASLGGIGWAASYDGDEEESFSESIDEHVDQAFRRISSRDYENFQTGQQSITIEEEPADNGVYLSVGLDSDEEDVEDLRKLLQQETFLSEGADIFSTYSGTLLKSDQVEILGLEYDPGFQGDKVSYTFNADELRDATEGEESLEEYYRDVVSSF